MLRHLCLALAVFASLTQINASQSLMAQSQPGNPQPGSSSGRVSDASPHQAEVAAQRVQLDLEEALKLARQVDDARLRQQLERLLGRAHRETGHLAQALRSTQSSPHLAVDDKSFQNLMHALKRETFDKQRMSFVRTFAAKQRLSSKQAA